MQKKPNIRSLRYSDEIADMIERQVGDNFSQKFENLVTRAFYEVPQAEAELADLKKQIAVKRFKLRQITKKVYDMEQLTRDIEWRLKNLAEALSRAEKEEA